ncbi:hypothetical protein ACFL96_06750 [Thermoproteota archaeon]
MERNKMDQRKILNCVLFLLVLTVLLVIDASVVKDVTAIDSSNKILHIGDSHTAQSYGKNMDSLLKSTGANVETYGCVGAGARSYINGGYTCNRGSTFKNKVQNYEIKKIDTLLQEVNPDVVVVSLGANYLDRPSQSKDLVAKLQGKTCFWIGPPRGPNKPDDVMAKFYDTLNSVKGHCTVIDSRPYTAFKFCNTTVCCCNVNVHFDNHGQEGREFAKSWAQNAFNTIQGAPTTPGGAPGTGILKCDGGDLDRLANVKYYSKCLKHRDMFDQYAKKHGLYDMGVDLLTLFMIAVGESGCNTREEMKALGKNTANGGIMQVDFPCYHEPEKCPTLDDEMNYGMKEVASKLKKVMDKGFSGEEALTMLLFAYNRGEGTMNRAINNMKEQGMSMFEACDEACSYFYGWPDGRCGKASKGKKCNYDFYCGKDSRDSQGNVYAVHYATKRIKGLKSTCEKIGGQIVAAAGPVAQPQLGPNATFASGFMYGINANVLAPYSVMPSFTVKAPSSIDLFIEAMVRILDLSDCSSDLICIQKKIVDLNARKDASIWLAKYAGTVLPHGSHTKDSAGALWTDMCEDTKEYLLYSFAEPLYALKNSVTDDCTIKMNLYDGVDMGTGADSVWASLAQFFTGPPEVVLDKVGSSARISLAGEPVVVPNASLYVDDGSVKAASGYQIDFDKVDLSQEFMFYRENANKFVFVQQDQMSKYSNRSECNVSSKMVKFCVFDPEKEMWTFDQKEKRIINKTVLVKFAFDFRSRMTDVADFNVKPALHSSETVLLSWKRITTIDVLQYQIFYSPDTNIFVNKPSEQFFSDPTISSGIQNVMIDVSQIPDDDQFNSIDLETVPTCVWDDADSGLCSPQYQVYNESNEMELVALQPGVVYYDKQVDKYVYLLSGVANDKKVNYGIIGISKDQQKSPTLKAPVSSINAIDNQPPVPPLDLTITRTASGGISLQWNPNDIKNIDGSIAVDIDYYEVFCTPSKKDNYDNLHRQNKAPFRLTESSRTIDGQLLASKCSTQSRIILFPVDKAGNRFAWDIDSVSIG